MWETWSRLYKFRLGVECVASQANRTRNQSMRALLDYVLPQYRLSSEYINKLSKKQEYQGSGSGPAAHSNQSIPQKSVVMLVPGDGRRHDDARPQHFAGSKLVLAGTGRIYSRFPSLLRLFDLGIGNQLAAWWELLERKLLPHPATSSVY